MNNRDVDRGSRPKLIVLAGLPGTGKSTLARLLTTKIDAVWLRVDTIEASVLKAGVARSFETGWAAYLVAADLAREHLRLGRSAVIDAVNGVEPARRVWRELAEECGVERWVVEVICSDPDAHRRRVETRASETPPLPAPTWEEVSSREYVPWAEPTLVVDGLAPPTENLSRILGYLGSRLRQRAR